MTSAKKERRVLVCFGFTNQVARRKEQQLTRQDPASEPVISGALISKAPVYDATTIVLHQSSGQLCLLLKKFDFSFTQAKRY